MVWVAGGSLSFSHIKGTVEYLVLDEIEKGWNWARDLPKFNTFSQMVVSLDMRKTWIIGGMVKDGGGAHIQYPTDEILELVCEGRTPYSCKFEVSKTIKLPYVRSQFSIWTLTEKFARETCLYKN